MAMGQFAPSLPIVVLTESIENANTVAMLNPQVFARFPHNDIHGMAYAVQESGVEVVAARIYAVRKTLPTLRTGIWVGADKRIW